MSLHEFSLFSIPFPGSYMLTVSDFSMDSGDMNSGGQACTKSNTNELSPQPLHSSLKLITHFFTF